MIVNIQALHLLKKTAGLAVFFMPRFGVIPLQIADLCGSAAAHCEEILAIVLASIRYQIKIMAKRFSRMIYFCPHIHGSKQLVRGNQTR